MDRLIKNLVLVVAISGLLAGNANAAQSQIFGMDTYGDGMDIPQSLCVDPGEEIRISADLLTPWGERQFEPSNMFIWRITNTGGLAEIFDARYNFSSLSFRKGQEPNSIYVRVPHFIGGRGTLEVKGAYQPITTIRLVDRNAQNAAYCQYGPQDMYVSPGYPGQPPTEELPVLPYQ